MQILRSATRIYVPSSVDERARALAAVEPQPAEPDYPCDPPSEGREHWEAVWAAYAASRHELREPAAAPSAMQLAQQLPIPIERGAHRLIALVPPPEGVGPAWIAVYLDAKNAVVVERVTVPAATRAAIYHAEARALVAVELLPFTDVHPHFFVESVYDEDGETHEWHDAVDFARMPTDPDEYILAQQFSTGTKLGGFAVHNAQYDASPMRYALHLAADFFDCTFGDTGSLHVWLSKDDSAVMMDSA